MGKSCETGMDPTPSPNDLTRRHARVKCLYLKLTRKEREENGRGTITLNRQARGSGRLLPQDSDRTTIQQKKVSLTALSLQEQQFRKEKRGSLDLPIGEQSRLSSGTGVLEFGSGKKGGPDRTRSNGKGKTTRASSGEAAGHSKKNLNGRTPRQVKGEERGEKKKT